jgi:1-acyl-sn-glycerol-3-phosphate acyltransferase
VDKALSVGARLGLAPGGISEMFEGFPKPGTHPDEEYAITRHKGFLKLAMKHRKAVIPIYCFGASKMFRRLQLPSFFERLSKILKTSIVIFFGRWGLPIPFRQRLLYVVGEPIYPRYIAEGKSMPLEDTQDYQHQLDELHSKFCAALTKLFERHKESYGWGHKVLKLI